MFFCDELRTHLVWAPTSPKAVLGYKTIIILDIYTFPLLSVPPLPCIIHLINVGNKTCSVPVLCLAASAV